MTIIAAEDLVYDYPGARALDRVSFEVQPGTITALVGPNGAGKTTLLRCLAVLDRPASGRIFLDGRDVAGHPRESHRKLGYLSDFYGLYDELTVRQCLSYHAAIHDLAPAEQDEAAARTAQHMDLGALMERRAAQLSRGQRQRLAIAQAIIHDPQVLLLDEPAAGLSPEETRRMVALVRALKGRYTIVLIEHKIDIIMSVSDRISVMHFGSLIAEGTPEEIQRNPEVRRAYLGGVAA
jgi:ABC-2 type transport system ATP-binding protein